MNPDNQVHLSGTVHSHHITGPAWTCWKPGACARGQVRFWLAVSRDLAGEGFDIFLCAIEPQTAPEVVRLERELKAGRTVQIDARARQLSKDADERRSHVIFIAETCGFDGQAAVNAHKVGIPHRRHSAHGKMAAAGDVEPEQPELPATALEQT